MDIYAFFSDEALWNYSNSDIATIPDVNTGVGYLTDNMINYFNTPVLVNDKRTQRLLLLGSRAKGESRLYTDQDRFDGGVNPFAGAQESELQQLFNTIEYIYLVQNKTRDEIDTDLQSDGSTYGAYIADSLQISSTATTTHVNIEDGSPVENIDIRNWIEFEFTLNTHTHKFHIWLKGADFLNDYPYCTIVDIIMPAEPGTFLHMTEYDNVVDAISKSAQYVNQILDQRIHNGDHSGMMPYTTTYHNNNFASEYQFSFGVLYKGRPPTIMEARSAIRQALLDTGLADEDTWRELFPDLFVNAQFFIVPMWDNTYILPTKTIYPSIIDYTHMYDIMHTIFPNRDEIQLKDEMEVMTNSATEMLLATLPAEQNEDRRSIKAEHPTYLSVDATTPAWDDQELKTREFNQDLSNCIGVLLGGVNVYGYMTANYQEREWLVFVSNFVEYLVLKQDSFPGLEP